MSQPLERLLVVAFRYPPYAAVGGKRWAKLSKYLARQGVDVHVVTVPWGPETPETMRDVTHPNVHIHRIPSLVPARIRVTSPEPHTLTQRTRNRLCRTQFYRTRVANRHWATDAALWGPAIAPALTWLTRSTGAQAVVATGGPFWVGHWVGRSKRLLPRVPLIQEFRDPWLDLPEEMMPSQGGRRRVRRAEQRLIASADAIVTVTSGLSDLIRQRAGNAPVYTIPNGYDPEDLPAEMPPRARPFRLIHGGNLYVGRQQPLRAFLDVITYMRNEIPELELAFMGKFPLDVRAEYVHLEQSGVLKILPPIPGTDFMRELDDSFGALQFNSEYFPYLVSTKIYEYGAARRPVLSVNYGGEIESLVKTHGLGKSVDARDPGSIRDTLLQLHAEWSANPASSSEPVGLEAFSYPHIARQYAELVSRVRVGHST